jgi:uncharacterized protein (DUF1810 family)
LVTYFETIVSRKYRSEIYTTIDREYCDDKGISESSFSRQAKREEERAVISDPFDLNRFVEAQAPVYERVVGELKRGRKESHWMWFIFPQASGLGRSAMSKRYAIRSAEEARAYLAHPTLGPRLRECAALAEAALKTRTLEEIFGEVDANEVSVVHGTVRTEVGEFRPLRTPAGRG